MPKAPRVKSIRVRRRRPTCLGCSLRGFQCHYGTLAGSCTECGQHKATISVSEPSTFFSQVPNTLSQRIQQAQAIGPLQPDGSPNNLLRVQTITMVDGTKRTHTLAIYGGDYEFEKRMKEELNLLVRQFCFPKNWTEPRTELCQAVMDARGYLALLLSPVTKEQRTTIRNGDTEDEAAHGDDLALQLVSIIFSRLDDIIGLVMNALMRQRTLDDQEFWINVSIAAAILYKELCGVYNELVVPQALLFCGGSELTAHLRDQAKSAADNLMAGLLRRGLGCSAPLVSPINAALDNLHCKVLVESITLIQESHLVDMDELGESQASSATAFSPYRSPGLDQVSPTSIMNGFNKFTPFGTPNVFGVTPPSQYSNSVPMSYPAPMETQYQFAEPRTPGFPNDRLSQEPLTGPGYSNSHGLTNLPGQPWMNTVSQDTMQEAQYRPTPYKTPDLSHRILWPLPTIKSIPNFGDGWPDAAVIPVVNPGSSADYFGTDFFSQWNPQEDEYYSPPMSSYVSSADTFYPPPEASIPMASQFSAPFWPEQPYVTWRQS